jgi:dienelactone hydrolase
MYLFFDMRIVTTISLFFFLSLVSLAQEKVSFLAEDGLKITADLYLKDYNLPFIILCHQENSSRGEFIDIALRLQKLNYNCLAVDLRMGDKMNYVENETALRARDEKINISALDSRKDIEAAILYIRKSNVQPIILLGSSFSASLCLLIAKEKPSVQAVVAFSPGEYFRPATVVKEKIAGLETPIFVAVTDIEYEYTRQMLTEINDSNKILFKPSKTKGVHGAKALWDESEASDECWLNLILFFKRFRNV